MNQCQFKNRCLNINKFHSLTPSFRNQYLNRQSEQIFSFNNDDSISERKYMPFIYTKYKPYSHQRRMHKDVTQFGDYFNCNIEQTSFNQLKLKNPCSISPLRKKTLNSFLFTDSIQNQQQNPIIFKAEVRQFSFELPQMYRQQTPRKREYTILKKKKKVDFFFLINIYYMNIDPFNLFYEEFKYKLKKHNITCPNLEIKQLARKEWEQMNELEQFRFVYMSRRQEEAYLNFLNKIAINQENVKQTTKISKQDQKYHKNQFQINYSKTEACESQADLLEKELLNIYKNITINRYALMGNFGAVSLFGIQEKRQSVLIWHTLIDGQILKKSQLQALHQKVQMFLTP